MMCQLLKQQPALDIDIQISDGFSLLEIGFETAKRLLTERYCDPYRIIAAYRKEIKHWPQVKADYTDAQGSTYLFEVMSAKFILLQSYVG